MIISKIVKNVNKCCRDTQVIYSISGFTIGLYLGYSFLTSEEKSSEVTKTITKTETGTNIETKTETKTEIKTETKEIRSNLEPNFQFGIRDLLILGRVLYSRGFTYIFYSGVVLVMTTFTYYAIRRFWFRFPGVGNVLNGNARQIRNVINEIDNQYTRQLNDINNNIDNNISKKITGINNNVLAQNKLLQEDKNLLEELKNILNELLKKLGGTKKMEEGFIYYPEGAISRSKIKLEENITETEVTVNEKNIELLTQKIIDQLKKNNAAITTDLSVIETTQGTTTTSNTNVNPGFRVFPPESRFTESFQGEGEAPVNVNLSEEFKIEEMKKARERLLGSVSQILDNRQLREKVIDKIEKELEKNNTGPSTIGTLVENQEEIINRRIGPAIRNFQYLSFYLRELILLKENLRNKSSNSNYRLIIENINYRISCIAILIDEIYQFLKKRENKLKANQLNLINSYNQERPMFDDLSLNTIVRNILKKSQNIKIDNVLASYSKSIEELNDNELDKLIQQLNYVINSINQQIGNDGLLNTVTLYIYIKNLPK